jgi:predicted RNA-binding protein YlxR (DUF448 family)
VNKHNKRPGKHIPQRTCVGCREVLAKRSLMRIVRTPQGIQLDPSGKSNGRGAYIHNIHSCWERAIKGSLAQALKIELTDKDKQVLKAAMAALTEKLPQQTDNQGKRQLE